MNAPVKSSQMYLAEVFGTFCLVFTGTGAIIINQVSDGAVTHPGIALTFGFIVMSMIYALGDISGAHMNPAVTIAFWVGKRFSSKHLLPYIACQLLGAALASLLLRTMFWENEFLGGTLPVGPTWRSFVLEWILTLILMAVILRVSSGSKEKGIMAGAAIGSVVALEAMFAGPICGASMNPARSFGPAIVSGHIEFLWLYLLAPTGGAISAVFLDRWLVTPEEQ